MCIRDSLVCVCVCVCEAEALLTASAKHALGTRGMRWKLEKENIIIVIIEVCECVCVCVYGSLTASYFLRTHARALRFPLFSLSLCMCIHDARVCIYSRLHSQYISLAYAAFPALL